MYAAHRAGLETTETEWHLQIELMKFLETKWQDPDEGIWEVRGGPQQFTHSKRMAWVAFDRAVKMSEQCNCAAEEHVGRWRELRDEIHRQVCERGYNAKKKAFTQFYGSDELDASLLMMPLGGFLPIEDERVVNTIEAIERELMWEGFVLRYRAEINDVDGLPGGEGVFLPCSFWLAACLHLMGRKAEARGTQALDESISWLGVPRDDDAAHVAGERFAAGFLQKDVERVDQPDRFALRRNDGESIHAIRRAQAQCFVDG